MMESIGSILVGLALLINALVTAATWWQTHKNGTTARNIQATVTDVKTDVARVEANNNGHLKLLTSMLGTVDPQIAAQAAAKVLETARKAEEDLAKKRSS